MGDSRALLLLPGAGGAGGSRALSVDHDPGRNLKERVRVMLSKASDAGADAGCGREIQVSDWRRL